MPMRYATDPCPEDQAFRFKNGARARSLQELQQTLAQVPADVVQYHREHYHHWVRDILQDPPLAERVQQEGQRTADGEQLRRSLRSLLDPAQRTGAPGRDPARGAPPPPPPSPGPGRRR